MLREVTGWLIVLLLVGAVVGFGWMSQNPDAAWLERAEEWPVVGGLAEAFREAYLHPSPEEQRAARGDAAEPEVVVIRPPPPDGPLDLTAMMGDERARSASGGSAEGGSGPAGSAGTDRASGAPGAADRSGLAGIGGAPEIGEVEIPSFRRDRRGVSIGDLVPRRDPLMVRRIYERTWLLPGTVLRAESAAGASEVERTRELASVPVLERSGEWLQVQLRGRTGWADPATPDQEVGRPGRGSYYGRHAARPDFGVEKQVRETLGLRRPNGALGPYELYTDIEDEALLELLDGVAARLADAYSARYGLGLPKRRSGPVIALFADEADFQAIAEENDLLLERAGGFAAGGLALFFAGNRPHQVVVSSFVHELTHAFNKLAIGIPLPPWLEEGLASDLGYVWIEDPDAPAPGLTTGVVGRPSWSVQAILGASLNAPILPSYAPLTAFSRETFYGEHHRISYLESLLFVRCLLDARDSELAEGFRDFLSAAAGGFSPTPRRLIDRLGRDWPEVDEACLQHRHALQAEARRLLPDEGSRVSAK